MLSNKQVGDLFVCSVNLGHFTPRRLELQVAVEMAAGAIRMFMMLV
jgi:hypothetical protein